MSRHPISVDRQQSQRPQSRRKATGLVGLYQYLARHWYSVERMLAFRDYYHRTSFNRAVAVCVATPIPAMLVSFLIDCIPLQAPSKGWRANYMLWIRLFLECFAVSMGLVSQIRQVIVTGTISNFGAVLIATGTGVSYVSVAILVAALWKFPVPFGFVISVAPVVFFFCLFIVGVVGPKLLLSSPVLRQQIRCQLMIVATQGLVGVVYPVFSAVFNRLTGTEQAIFVLMMPLLKYTTKQMIANAATNLHEYVAPIVVFSVDVFNVFYVAICMQTSKSTVAMLVMVGADSFHVLIALRTIFHLTGIVKKRHASESGINYVRDLPDMIRSVFGDQGSPKTRIRVFAPFPLYLSNESVAFMYQVARKRRESHIYSSSRVHTSRRSRLISAPKLEMTNGFDKEAFGTNVMVSTVAKHHQIAPASLTTSLNLRSFHHQQTEPRIESFSKRVLSMINVNRAITSDAALQSAKVRRGTEEAAWEALRALFHSEYLLLTEYVECALPVLYAVYVFVLFHLPVAEYYPQTASLTSENLTKTVIGVTLYAFVELASFIGLLLLLRSKFEVSPLHQLAFVLETQVYTLQGHLFVWTIYILHLPLLHYGKY